MSDTARMILGLVPLAMILAYLAGYIYRGLVERHLRDLDDETVGLYKAVMPELELERRAQAIDQAYPLELAAAQALEDDPHNHPKLTRCWNCGTWPYPPRPFGAVAPKP